MSNSESSFAEINPSLIEANKSSMQKSGEINSPLKLNQRSNRSSITNIAKIRDIKKQSIDKPILQNSQNATV